MGVEKDSTISGSGGDICSSLGPDTGRGPTGGEPPKMEVSSSEPAAALLPQEVLEISEELRSSMSFEEGRFVQLG